MEKIRIGIIGCSQIAQNSVIPAIKKSKYAELKFIGSRNNKKARKFAEKFNCKNFGRYEDVFDSKNVDAVYISTPVGLHEKWAIESMKNQKHVLCEKSISDSYKSAKKMIRSASENNVRLMEGMMFRFHPSHKTIKNFIKKYLGETYAFYGRYGFPPISKNNIRYDKKLGGGIINDAVCYPICASRIIFEKEPSSVFSSVEIEPEIKIDERVSVTLNFDDDHNAHMVCGYNLGYQNTYSVWGEKGTINLSRSFNIPPKMKPNIEIISNKILKKIKTEPANHFVLMVDSFCKNILKKTIENFEKELLKQAKIMEGVRLSAKQKKVITLSQIK